MAYRQFLKMRRVLFSDLHGNDLALESLLEREADTILSAGIRYLIQIGSLREPREQCLPRYLSWTETAVEWHR